MKKQDKIADLENKWKRALADYANLEKRVEKEKEDFVKFFNAVLLVKLLGILDDLEKCQRHSKDQGLALICDRFAKIIKEEGLEEIQALNNDFDPNLMEAVETVEGPKGKVAEVVLKGYKLNGKILRPAKVKVGSGELKKQKEIKDE